jgi:hypothetical protein
MKLRAPIGLGLILAATTSPALAEDNRDQTTPARRFEATRIAISPEQAVMVPHEQVNAAAPPSRIIYLNNCIATNGCTVRPGGESSINDTSSIIGSTANISKYERPDVWAQIVDCVRETYAPFNISVTDVDPGNVPHWENIVAGSPEEAGMPSNVGGVSPWAPGR